MAGHGGSRSKWRGVAVGAGLLAVAGCVTVVALTLRSGLASAASAVTLVSAAVAALRWWRRTATPVVLPGRVSEAQQVLAGMVARQWRSEALLRSLDDPDPMPVQWRLTQREGVMDHPANLTPRSLLLTASSDDITALVQEFRGMRRRRLVILGGAGTGGPHPEN